LHKNDSSYRQRGDPPSVDRRRALSAGSHLKAPLQEAVSHDLSRYGPRYRRRNAVLTLRGDAHADCGYSCWVVTTAWLVQRAAIACASAVMLVAACANDPESLGQPPGAGPEAIATNLEVPWGIAFLPDGSALIAERDSGAIQHMAQPGVVNTVGGVAGVAARGEGGLLGLATAGQTVFAYLTTAQDNRVVTMRFDETSLTEVPTMAAKCSAPQYHPCVLRHSDVIHAGHGLVVLVAPPG
jgi:hypothetical protein